MKNQNIRETMKSKENHEIDYNELNKKAINSRIKKYELMKYEHILQEILAIRDIIKSSTGRNEEITIKYNQLLAKLIQEKEIIEKDFKDEEDFER